MKSPTKTTVRRVKGYALLTSTGAFYEAIESDYANAHHYWEHEFEDLNFSIVPCTISYQLPTKRT